MPHTPPICTRTCTCTLTMHHIRTRLICLRVRTYARARAHTHIHTIYKYFSPKCANLRTSTDTCPFTEDIVARLSLLCVSCTLHALFFRMHVATIIHNTELQIEYNYNSEGSDTCMVLETLSKEMPYVGENDRVNRSFSSLVRARGRPHRQQTSSWRRSSRYWQGL
jgi:hypothetical protein